MTFEDLKLISVLTKTVRQLGYEEPTPIQSLAIPDILAGRDVLGLAQTGTGKTAAFSLPILQQIHTAPQAKGKKKVHTLVLTPTRELANQVYKSFAEYGTRTQVQQVVLYGGVGYGPQIDKLKRGVDVVVATPGRLMDMMKQRHIDLSAVQTFVLDEADRMLDMGFIDDIRLVVRALPKQRQTLLFSATMPMKIRHLANSIMEDPVEVSVTPSATTVDAIEQQVYFVERGDKPGLLMHLLEDEATSRVLVFVNTRHSAESLVKRLSRQKITADDIHGNKSQKVRERTLKKFLKGAVRVLVATDVAARGLDFEDITHVVNYDVPEDVENYVHRIGRTGRAGASGIALSFCAIEERPIWAQIERLIRKNPVIVEDHPFPSPLRAPTPTDVERSTTNSEPTTLGTDRSSWGKPITKPTGWSSKVRRPGRKRR